MAKTQPVKIVYISPSDEKTWQEIHEAAEAEKRGVGYYICRLFEKTQAEK